MASESSKILIVGGTGYVGKYMVKASVSMGHPTYVYARPITSETSSSKQEQHREIESMGGDLDEHEKLVHVIQQVDVVIPALAIPQYPQQIKIINAIKEAGNIKKFVPSDFGNESERITGLPPFQAIFDSKKKIRRATEASGIPYTFVTANAFAAYFIDYLFHPHEQREDVTVYGSGEAKAVLNFEEDVAAYTIKAAVDPRTLNRIMMIRPPGNIITQLKLISAWEKKSGRSLKKVHIPEELVKLSETLPHPDNVPPSILHNIFAVGAQMSFELREEDLEASKLFPDYQYTSVDRLLDICVVNPPPKPKLTSF
uniref:NmrA-like domain-containing protein n=1 Tax=Nelumbo nucifera TaxID=4432 RepID=A0A822XUT9_NELNU|nr:TPA_asm: hypothetical protein HUJ06_022681 [Nelumbo nucifera]